MDALSQLQQPAALTTTVPTSIGTATRIPFFELRDQLQQIITDQGNFKSALYMQRAVFESDFYSSHPCHGYKYRSNPYFNMHPRVQSVYDGRMVRGPGYRSIAVRVP